LRAKHKTLLGEEEKVTPMQFEALIIAGVFNFVAALLHVAVIFGGADWYRFFGAGEAMAAMAEQGSLKPTIITALIALVLFVWGLYAWSGAGLIPALPLMKIALVSITSIYLLRGLGGLVAPFVSDHPQVKENSTRFWIISSVICLLFAFVHIQGLVNKWPQL
jgi:hypothetical protein